MNKTIICVGAAFLAASTALSALTGEQVASFKEKFRNSDPTIRIKAFDELEKENPRTMGNDIIPLLSLALDDQDPTVRLRAAATLAATAFTTLPKAFQKSEDVTDLRSYAPLKPALVAAFDDSNVETRKNALAAYFLTFRVPPAVQNSLVGRYDSEPANSLFKAAILEALTIDGAPTPAAKDLLTQVAARSADAMVLAQVIQDSEAPPAELLPQFVSRFSSASDFRERALFARAIAKFGVLAKPYIPTLEGAADHESDEVTRKTITAAVADIRASPPKFRRRDADDTAED
ncbi:MAG: hypothetical protein ABIR29_11880 [Chthoniobacterales bacterium]